MTTQKFTNDDVLFALTCKSIPPGQITLYKALYEANDQGLSSEELAERMRWGDRVSLRGVLGALGNRINQAAKFQAQKPGFKLLIDKREVRGGCYYHLWPNVREVINMLPELHQAISLSVEDIHKKYAGEENWLVIRP